MTIQTITGVEEEERCTIVTLSTIWYHLYNLKNGKNTHGGVLLLLLKLQS